MSYALMFVIALALVALGIAWERRRHGDERESMRAALSRSWAQLGAAQEECTALRAELDRRIATRSEASKRGAVTRRARIEANELAREAENRLIEGEMPDVGEGDEEGAFTDPLDLNVLTGERAA